MGEFCWKSLGASSKSFRLLSWLLSKVVNGALITTSLWLHVVWVMQCNFKARSSSDAIEGDKDGEGCHRMLVLLLCF